MTSRKILFGSHNYWTTPLQVGSHALARAFAARGWQVGYVSDPISPLHALSGASATFRARYDIWRRGGLRTDEGVWTYVPATLASPYRAPLLRSDFVHRHWQSFTVPPLGHVLKKNGFDKVDILFMDSPFAAGLLDRVSYKRSVVRVADNLAGFSHVVPAAKQLQTEMIQQADMVCYTASTLEASLKPLAPKSLLHLPNGVRFKMFQEASRELPDAYRGLGKPIAVYVGALEEWFDYPLFNRAARELPHMSFVVIGDHSRAGAKFDKLPNVHLLGSIPHKDLPSYLHNADVGIIPFAVRAHSTLVNSINPLKLYEYMACGLPVVSVAWEELRRIMSPAILAEDADSFIAGLRQIRTTDASERKAYVDYAQAQDWEARADTIIASLGMGA